MRGRTRLFLALAVALPMLVLAPPAMAKPGGGGGGGTTCGTPTPTISVNSVYVVEGNAGSSSAVFTVSLSTPSSGQVAVGVFTRDRSATAGADYVAVPRTMLTFAPGQTSQTVPVTVFGDTFHEWSEQFDFNLAKAQCAVLGVSRGQGTIVDEEGPFFVTQHAASVVEGNSGPTGVTTEVVLSAAPASGETVWVDVVSADISATAGVDYLGLPTTRLTFGPGESVKPVPTTVLGDTLGEADEEYLIHQVGVSPNANIADSEVSVVIVDDDPLDSDPNVRWVYVTNAWVMEGDSGTTQAVFEVYLSSAPGPGEQVTVGLSTQDITATAGVDYEALSTVLTFGPGQISQTVTVTVYGDTSGELLEQFLLNTGSIVGATQADKRGRAFINSEEGP